MGEPVYLTQELTSLTCWAREGCGIQFAVPSGFYKICKEHGASFHCPRGHRLSIGESAVDKLTKERDRAIKEKEWAQQEVKHADARARTARRAEKLAKGKLRNQSERVKNGVCPCCKRTFKQLAAHMKCKHPDWDGEEKLCESPP